MHIHRNAVVEYKMRKSEKNLPAVETYSPSPTRLLTGLVNHCVPWPSNTSTHGEHHIHHTRIGFRRCILCEAFVSAGDLRR
jgi:hypothetical protein